MLPYSFVYPQSYSSAPLPSFSTSLPSNDMMFRAQNQSVNSRLPSISNLIHLPPLVHSSPVLASVPATKPIEVQPATTQQKTIRTEAPPAEQPKDDQDDEEDRIVMLLTSLAQTTTITASPKHTSTPHSPSTPATITPARPKRPSRSSSKSESEVDAKEEYSESSEEEASDFDDTFVEVARKRRRIPHPAPEPTAEFDSDDSALSPVTPASPSNSSETPSTSPTTSKKTSKKSNRAKYNDELWFQHFEELKKFKKKHGHTNVTQSHKGSKTLANWVHNQRKNQGRNMPPNRRKLLEDIGFEFNRAYAAVTFNKKKKEDGEEVHQEDTSV